MEWWVILAVIVVFGAAGGVVNAIMEGGEFYEVRKPHPTPHGWELGLIGPVIIGIASSFLAWAASVRTANVSSLRVEDIAALLAGCFLAGVGGSKYLTSQIKTANLQSARNSAIDTTVGAAERTALRITGSAAERK